MRVSIFMNYMNMVKFIQLDVHRAISRLSCHEREEFFRHYFKKVKIVPIFVITEAIFQTAGRIARKKKNSSLGGLIASYRGFEFNSPLFANQDYFIHAELKSENEIGYCFEAKISLDEAGHNLIMKPGYIIIARHNIKSKQFIDDNEVKPLKTIAQEFSYE